MTPRPHDALFKAAFEATANAAALSRAILPAAIRAAVAWNTLYCERGSFVDAMLADHHSDLLFSAGLHTGEPALVYFLLEHQSTDDPTMPLRMLSYQNRIWHRFAKEHPGARLPSIIAVLVSHVPGGWRAARAFEELFDPSVMALAGLGRNSFAVLLTYMLEVIGPMHRDELRAKLQKLGSHTEEVAMTIAEQLRKEGRKEGREKGIKKGRKEGRKEGRLDTLRSLLVFKFQTLGPNYEARLQAATPEAIDRYLQRLLTADSLVAVFED